VSIVYYYFVSTTDYVHLDLRGPFCEQFLGDATTIDDYSRYCGRIL
jgi:hypothetical protein